MSHLDKQKDYWKPCRPGTILGASDTRFQQDRRKFLIRSTMGAVVGSMGLFSAIFVTTHGRRRETEISQPLDTQLPTNANTLVRSLPQAPSGNITAISCSQIHAGLDDYAAARQQIENGRSDAQRELVRQFDAHLKICHSCNEFVSQTLQTG